MNMKLDLNGSFAAIDLYYEKSIVCCCWGAFLIFIYKRINSIVVPIPCFQKL